MSATAQQSKMSVEKRFKRGSTIDIGRGKGTGEKIKKIWGGSELVGRGTGSSDGGGNLGVQSSFQRVRLGFRESKKREERKDKGAVRKED